MYLDPGFGSMIIQVVIGGIAAIGAGFFIFRQKIKVFLKKHFNKENVADIDNEEPNGEGS